YYGRRDYPHAIEHYRYALRSKPDFVEAYQYIGRALRARGQYEEAIDEFERADILLHGGDPAAGKGSAAELCRAFEEEGERGYWLKMLEGTGSRPDSEFYWKAVVHVHLGDTEEA